MIGLKEQRVVSRTEIFLVVAGVAFGVATSSLNHGSVLWSVYLSKIAGNDWGWLTAAYLATCKGRNWMGAGRQAFVMLAPAVLAYYFVDFFAGVYFTAYESPGGVLLSVDLFGLLVDMIFYLAVSAAAAVALGFVRVATRRRDFLGMASSLALPGYIAFRALSTHQSLSSSEIPFDPPLLAVSGWVGIVACGTSLVVLIITIARLTMGLIATQEQARRPLGIDPGGER